MKAAGLSHIGYFRENNEDSYFYDKDIGLFILCDGMGGHLAGEVASGLAVETVKREVTAHLKEKEPVAVLRQAIEKANLAIWQKSHEAEQFKEMGTTMTVALIDGRVLIVAHVGDSSLYVFDKDQCGKITHDHTLAETMRKEMPEKDETEFNAYNHVLMRALGMEPQIRIDFFSRDLTGEETILLASDGLTDLLDQEEISELMRKPESVEEKAQTLVDAALAKGGYDNITVVLVQLNEGGR